MCLILVAHRVHPDAPLIAAANRDEFYARPAAAAHWWPEAPAVWGGKDLEAGGTWLGVSNRRRFAAVTNYAGVETDPAPPRSRGLLTSRFLTGETSAWSYVHELDLDQFRGFNLLVWDGHSLCYVSNRGQPPCQLPPGIYGLANAALDSRWPKITGGTAALADALYHDDVSLDSLLGILADETVPPDDELPDRGRELALERRVAPRFIRGDDYGTRASTAVIFHREHIEFAEQLLGPGGEPESRHDVTLEYRCR